MKMAAMILMVLMLFACSDGGKTLAKADSLGRMVDTTLNTLADSAGIKGGRLLDSAKINGTKLWDSTQLKGGRLLTDVKHKWNNLKKKDTIK